MRFQQYKLIAMSFSPRDLLLVGIAVALAFGCALGDCVSAWAQGTASAHPPEQPSSASRRLIAATPEKPSSTAVPQPVEDTAPETGSTRPSIDDLLREFKPRDLPPEPATDHNANKVLNLGPLRQSTMIRLSATRPIRLEASYSEPLTLRKALEYTLAHNLPIRISDESWKYQQAQFFNQLSNFLPSFSTSLNLTNSDIFPDTISKSLVYQDTVRFPVFQGGNAVYTALTQYYRMKGWKQAYISTLNDSLLDVYQRYANLLLNTALLQIRTKSLQVSEEQLELNNALYKAGTGTQFAIMQSRTQLASDRQALLQQQVVLREAAMALAYSMNVPMAINLVPAEEEIAEMPVMDEKLQINDLLSLSLSHRPELRQYELFRLAAARNVQVAASTLYPTASFFTTYTHSKTVVTPPSNAKALNGVASASVTSSNTTGTASNTALAQTASFSPGGSVSGTTGANAGAATTVAGGGGNPQSTVQSGNLVTSGAVAPSFSSGNSGGSGGGSTNTAGAGVFGGLFNTFQAGFTLSWSLPNFGVPSIANIVSARALSRQALLQANQELLAVTEQVRGSYLNAIAAREQIDNTAYGVASAAEALRLANLRLRTGVGTNLELITAQRDYVTALTQQAQSITASNLAQAQLLHDTGIISFDTLTRGYYPSAAELKEDITLHKR